MLYFYTDYMEGAHPEVMRRLMETNLEHTTGYGSDQYTQRAKQLIREACGGLKLPYISLWEEHRPMPQL